VKKFSIPCDFGGQRAVFDFYLEEPCPDLHPLKYQQLWLWEHRGGKVVPEIQEGLEKVLRLTLENAGALEALTGRE
jgi:hypothetical protein